MTGIELPAGIQHGTPEGFTAGCRKEKDCPASYEHGMCCLYAHVRSTTDVRYFKAKARDPRPAAIARQLGITPLDGGVAEKEAHVDELFANRSAGYRYRTRKPAPTPTPAHPKEPTMPTPADVAKTTKKTQHTAPKTAAATPLTTDKWTHGLSAAKKATRLSEIRTWCRTHGYPGVPTHGRIPQDALAAYDNAHPTELTPTEIEADKNAAEARAAIAAATATEDAAQPLAESAHDSDPQEDAGTPAIETEAPTAPSEPAAEDEAMGHPTNTGADAITIEEALAEGTEIPAGNDYTDKLDEARERAHAATPAELADIFGVDVDDIPVGFNFGATYENARQRFDGLTREITEQLYAETHPEQPRPEWATVAISEDVERARATAVRLEQELAEAERQRDEAQRSMILALRQWADGRAELEQLRLELAAMTSLAQASRRSNYAIANMRRAQASQHRRWLRRGN